VKEQYDDPKFYEHVFYPKSAWKLIAGVLIVPFVAFAFFYLQEFVDPKKSIPLKIKLFILGGSVVFFVFPIIVFRLRQLKKVQLGIGKAGFYTRGLSKLLTWSEIKTIDLVKHPKHGKSIKIQLHGSYEQEKKTSSLAKIFHLIALVFGEDPNILYIYNRDFISIPLEELLILLRKCHEQYKTLDADRQQLFGKAEKIIKPEDWAKKVSMFCRKVIVLFVFAVGIMFYAWAKGETDIWIVGGITILALSVGLFKIPRLTFIWIISVGFMFLGLGFFFYSLIWEGKIEWLFLLVAFGGPILFWRFWIGREKKLS